MRLLLTFFRIYPAQTAIMLVALLLAGVAEGIGLSAVLPLLNIAINSNSGGEPNAFEQQVLSVVTDMGLAPTVGTMLVVIFIGFTLKSILLLYAQKKVGYIAAQIATDLRLDMLRSILRSRWEYFLHQPIGKLTNALATEASRSSDAFVNVATVMTFLIQAVIYGSVAVALSWKASLVCLAVGALVVLATHFLVRMARAAGKKQTKLVRSLMSRLTDSLQSVKPLKAMSREHLVSAVLESETSRINKALQRQVLSAAVLNAVQVELFAIIIAVGVYVALEVYGMPLATVMVLVVTLGKMLDHIGKVQKQYQKAAVGESAFTALREEIAQARRAEEHLPAGRLPQLQQGISLEGVSFSYDGRRDVLQNVSFDIPSGTINTIIGPSGSGKTTIVDLVIGLLRPREGAVRVDGVDLGQLDARDWRKGIGYVPQETLLLHDSIRNNITLGDPALSEQDVKDALMAAGAWEFIGAMSEGIDTIVGERGGRLSGGQRQRIAIARALVNRPRLLILDEATSALDPASEQAVRDTLKQLHGKLTILAISHQTGLVDAADHVWRIDNGRILSHSECAVG